MHISLDLLSLSIHWVRWKTEQSFDDKLCQEYLYQKLLKSDNWFSSYSENVGNVFLRHSVVLISGGFKGGQERDGHPQLTGCT